MYTCVIKRLPEEQGLATPQHIAAVLKKTWGPAVDLSVQFLDTNDAALKARILSHMNAWSQYGNVKFHLTDGTGDIRIAINQGGGYASFLGTDNRLVPAGEPTMWLQDFSMSTPESEYRRVVRHETGHALAFPHEHARPEIIAQLDPNATIREFSQLYGWDSQTTREQVLTPLNPSTLVALPPDIVSIMCYMFSKNCTRNGQPIPGGLDIDAEDGAMVAKLYPSLAPTGGGDGGGTGGGGSGGGTNVAGRVNHIAFSGAIDDTLDQSKGVLTVKGGTIALNNVIAKSNIPIPPALWPVLIKFGFKFVGLALRELAAGKSIKQVINDIEVAVFGVDPTPGD